MAWFLFTLTGGAALVAASIAGAYERKPARVYKDNAAAIMAAAQVIELEVM